MKNQNYSWLKVALFFGMLFSIVILSSCSDSSDKIEISKQDWDLIISMKMNDNDILISPINDEPEILDLDGNPLVANQLYLRKKGILQLIELQEETQNSIMPSVQDSTAKWLLNPDLWVRSINSVSSWKSIQADMLYLVDMELNVDRITYVTLVIPEPIKIISTEIYQNSLYEGDDIFNPGREIDFNNSYLRVWGRLINVELPMWDSVKFHDDYLDRMIDYDTSWFKDSKIEFSNETGKY